MKKKVFTLILCISHTYFFTAQNIVSGLVKDAITERALYKVSLSVSSTNQEFFTDVNGAFRIDGMSNGEAILTLQLLGYETQKFPLRFTGKPIDLGILFLYANEKQDQDLSFITLSDDELNDDTNASDNITGMLQATKDTYLKTAAFEFGSSFFRVRGLDSKYGKVLINGIEMNKFSDGRPQWSNWGGLNDVMRDQEFSNGFSPSPYTFGGLLGTTNISTRASNQRPGVRVSYASSNRSYVHRAMATYSSGVLKGDWAYSISASRRVGQEGFNQGTTYNAYSLFGAVEKRINTQHSINFTGIFTPNRRGKAAPSTREVMQLKGIDYNEYWGYLNGNKINSRIKEVVEPILLLNHDWKISENTSLNTNVGYQFGRIGNSRIDFNGGANPSPIYYQYLPSFYIRNGDELGAFQASERFKRNGQLDWHRIYDANLTNALNGRNNAYVFYEDRNDEKQVSVNTILTTALSQNITLHSKLEHRVLRSENFAEVIDLLGGNGYLDINPFAELPNQKQNNLLTPNRVVGVGDRFRYHYLLRSQFSSGFVQAQFLFPKIDFYSALSISSLSYQREGLFQNGRYETNSLGLSSQLNFTDFAIKSGATYKISGRHLINFNTGYLTQAPTLRNSFSNPRENNNIVDDLTSEKVFSLDLSYILRAPKVQSRLTAFYTGVANATEVSFYFADGVGGDNSAFVQEVLSNIERRHLGVEFGMEADITTTIKVKAAAAIGQHVFANNPNLYITTDTPNEGIFDNTGRSKDYISNLKNYRLASGPQNAFSIGFEYRDPEYWWIGATTNFFSNSYADVAPLTRTSNFFTDNDGLPFVDYDPELAKTLLQQERFNDYMVVNLVGGKSWRIGKQYLSVFASVNNLLNQQFISGGFEQGRNANFRQLRDDRALQIPVFGNRYWFGRGTTYFLNISLSFN